MRAIEEVGIKKTIRFLLYCFVQISYHTVIDHILYFSHARKIALSLMGAQIGKESIIMNAKFFNWHHKGPGGLSVGSECFIGEDCLIDLYDEIVLEDQVTLAPKVVILTHTNVGYKNHPLQKQFPKKSQATILKKGCVIGTGAIIMPGITIGQKSFVGAGSVVTKNVKPNTVVAGNPAKKIRNLTK